MWDSNSWYETGSSSGNDSGSWLHQPSSPRRPTQYDQQGPSRPGTPFLLRNSWGTWDKPQGNELAVRDPNTPESPDVLDALLRIGATKLLTKPAHLPGGIEIPSWADQQQTRVMGVANRLAERAGVHGEITLPSEENIALSAAEVAQKYLALIPDGAVSPPRLDDEVHQESHEMLRMLATGRTDDDYETTDDERRLAYELKALIGLYPAEKLKRIYNEKIWGRIADIVWGRKGATLAYYHNQLTHGMQALARQPVNRWFAVDWITSEVMMTPQEQKAMENTLWGISPSALHIRRIDQRDEDYPRIPLSVLTRSQVGGGKIVVQEGTLDYVDILRKGGTRLLQPIVNRLTQEGLGGVVVLRSYERDRDVAKFAVRNSHTTAQSLAELGGLISGYTATQEMMTRAIREPDMQFQYPIRPGKVKELLPDKVVLEMDVETQPNGEINWSPAIAALGLQRQETSRRLREFVYHVSGRIDPQTGEPLTSGDRHALRSIQRELQEAGEAEERLKALQTINKKEDPTCPRCGAPLGTRTGSCAYCNSQINEPDQGWRKFI